MFLKSIELFGFKSFADKSRIDFTEGISALLGPNGCGKSNVVDAIKWVLGEQSTRTLRAEKMEDVIFAGTEGRKPLSVAEVTLTLSNDSGQLPIDLPEISIKRRLYRSGESEYSVNNVSTKLKDLRELFYDTGVGKSAYSIMEQGKIDQILSNKPEDRRYIFEEAAGITKYRIRGAEAERKLERTEDNMRQVARILDEVKRSHDSLKVQAEKTNVYRELREQIYENELHINLLRLKSFLETEEKKQDLLESKTAQREKIKEKIAGVNKALEANLDQVNNMESTLIEKQKRLYKLELESNNCDSQAQIQKERIEELKRAIEGSRERTQAIGKNVGVLTGQIDEKNTDLSDLNKRIVEIDDNISSFESNIESAQLRLNSNAEAITGHLHMAESISARLDKLQSELVMLYDDIVTQLDTRLTETGYSHQRRKTLEDKLAAHLSSFTIHLEGRFNLLRDSLDIATTSEDEKNRIISSFVAYLDESVARAKDLEKTFFEFRDSVPAFIDDFLAPQGIITRKREIDKSIAEAQAQAAEHRRQAESLTTENKRLGERIEEYRKTLEDLRIARARMTSRAQSIEESVALLKSQRRDLENQLEASKKDISSAERRKADLYASIEQLIARKRSLSEEITSIESQLARLETGIANRNKELVSSEQHQHRNMAALEKLQNEIEGLQVDLASLRTEMRNLYENFRERHSRELTDYQDRMLEISTPVAEYRNKLADVREKLRELGQVNLMAPEEYEEVRERYEFLSGQLDDLKKAREDLRVVTEQIKVESSQLFIETYEKIKKAFHQIFRRLFGGGRAELSLVEPKKVLDSGIAILAQPPGKNLESIDLLSGGEKSLTAVALLFATYMVKPSPFCVLDEIDAALDEENVTRFASLLKEFSNNSQFIIITHNKRTVAAAETLLGVTMEESGVSKAISVRIGGRETAEVLR
ncbi:MAG: AAA family ATPase [Spirochaetales bacterium]|nr:AAA family ATPase [Spirochaetales bacterium]